MRYNPQDGSTHALVDGLWFANGVALSREETFVAVAETAGMRVIRHWLKGDKVMIAHQCGSDTGAVVMASHEHLLQLL